MIESNTRFPGARLMTPNDHRQIEAEGELSPVQQKVRDEELIARADRLLDIGRQIKAARRDLAATEKRVAHERERVLFLEAKFHNELEGN